MSEWVESEGDEWKGEENLADFLGEKFRSSMSVGDPKLLGMFILDENQSPVLADSTLAWGEWMESAERHVGDDVVGRYRVSTVFLGLDHRFTSRGWPVLFETMVFHLGENGERQLSAEENDDIDMMQERYCTWAEAEKGHARMVEHVQQALAARSK